MSIGIISGLKRNSGHSMQTSALMNYGNIGGPIIDRSGRLLGMANALSPESSWRQNCGVGFYFQAHHLAEAIETLAKGKPLDPIPRPLIGVRIDSDSVTGRAWVMGLSQHQCTTRRRSSGRYHRKPQQATYPKPPHVVDAIEQAGVNQEVELVVLRNNKEVTLTLTIQDRQISFARKGTLGAKPVSNDARNAKPSNKRTKRNKNKRDKERKDQEPAKAENTEAEKAENDHAEIESEAAK